MLNNTLLRNIFVSLVLALLGALILLLLMPGTQHPGDLVKAYLLMFVLLMLAASVNEYLRLKALGLTTSKPLHAFGKRTGVPVRAATAEGTDGREEGMVKWFNVNKGFGFIIRDTGGEVFVHFRAIRGHGHRTLREGQRVRFATAEGEKGLQAEDVSILD